MARRIVLINGHPDGRADRFCAALVAAYEQGARAAGHELRRIDVAALDLPPIHTMEEFTSTTPEKVKLLQDTIAWADHLVIAYPLWLGALPAVTKAFFEQTFRYGFALAGRGGSIQGLLKGRSARVYVTMGMPASIFRLVFASAGARALTRGVLMISGFGPIRTTIIGDVDGAMNHRDGFLAAARRDGRRGA